MLAAAAAPAADEAAVVVVRAAPGRAAAAAGLREGDLLLRWEQEDASGALRSPFDLGEVEIERGPRGPVRLIGRRQEQPLAVSLFPDDWGLEVKPGAEAGAEAEAWRLREAARGHQEAKRPQEMEAALRQAIAAAERGGRKPVQAQLWTTLGAWRLEAERFDEAIAAFRSALDLRRQDPAAALAAAALAERITAAAYARGKGMEESRPALKEALAVQEKLAHRSLALVRTMNTLGPVLDSEAEARQLFERAFAITRELAPDSLLQAMTLQLTATVTSDLQRKTELARAALAIREKLSPDGLPVSDSLRQIGTMLNQQGQPVAAEEHLRRALAIQERLAPGTRSHGRTLNTLAILAKDRGDLAESESLFRRYLGVIERGQPDSIWVAIGYLNFGELLHDRKELADAEAYLQKALAIVEREAPQSDVAGYCLATRGVVAQARGRAADAKGYLQRGLEVFRHTDPRNQMIPYILQELGDLELDRGALDAAQEFYQQAFAAAAEKGPATTALAYAHHSLGALAARRDDLAAAEKHHLAALEMRRAVAPDSVWEAESRHALGLVFRRQGRRAEALEMLRGAVAALESQSRRLGGSAEVRAEFRTHYQQMYRDLEELLLEMARPEEAFATVERSRARALLALLAARDVRFQRDAPPELEAARRAADAGHDRILRRLGTPRAPLGEAERAALRKQLEEARKRQDEVRAQLRAAAPRQAALRDPEPLDLAAVRATLPAGTLLLAYSVGGERSRLYAVGPGAADFSVHDLQATEAHLRAAVSRFRQRLEASRGALGRRALEDEATRLGRTLLGPAAPAIARAQRLLVVPDGVLHLLPWAALRSGGAYLVESRPVQVTSSATLYAQLTRRETPAERATVVGFGDPDYARRGAPAAGGARAAGNGSAAARALGRLRLQPLPATRGELEALRAVAPQGAQIWLGPEATEERAKAVDRSARIVHFAAHGFMDEALPLESGLALSIPAADADATENGILQAWEIFEGVRLDADLVTLSACQTALGKEVVGEGLLGLTWAFQYAGARRVLASLWEVSDASTAVLMGGFYRHLSAGVPSDEALRRAQAGLLRRPATSAPYHWAAFTLIGGGH